MPLPLFLGIGAVAAGAAGAGAFANGALKMNSASKTMKSAQARQTAAIEKFEVDSSKVNTLMDKIGKTELEALKSFEEFSTILEKIQNKPVFQQSETAEFSLPEYDPENLKKVSVGAGILLGGIGGAAAGTAGGFAAAGATTAAVMALGTASTGTAIASLSGVAATNATLAAIGGGALAAGGGGMALGSTILGAATLGVGVLVGGIIFGVAGHSLSAKADEAEAQVKKTETEISRICYYLQELHKQATRFDEALLSFDKVYRAHLNMLDYTVNLTGKTDWTLFTEEQKLMTENTVLLVAMMYRMCQTKLVLISQQPNQINQVNKAGIDRAIMQSEIFLKEKGLDA